jgi:predicted acetyltransferase
MTEIRKLNEQEADECLDLSVFAFQYELSEEERKEKRSKLHLEEYWGYYDDGKLAAKMRLIPLKLFLQGQIFNMGGIASVSTWPEFRRKGIVGKLLTHALQEMKRQGQLISVLHPFSFAFYRKYGWETNTEYKLYSIDRSQLPVIKNTKGMIKRVNDPENHWEVFHQIYLKHASDYNGMLQRDKNWWQEIVFVTKKGTAVICYSQNNEPSGYLLYSVQKKEMIIKEMVFLDEAARKSLWEFISNHDSMVERVSIVASPDDSTAFLLPDPRIKQEIKPYSMARIVDVKAFLEQFPFTPTDSETHFILDLSDDHADWNHGKFAVHINREGKAIVEYNNHSNINPKNTLKGISCNIQTFSAMMSGYQRPINLQAYGRLLGDVDLIRWLEDTISHRSVYLTDFF